MLSAFLNILLDFATLLVVLAVFLGVGMKWGIESLRLVLLSLYLAVLVWLMFPHHELATSILGDSSLARFALFALFETFTFWIASYILHRSYEKPFEFFGKKIIYASAGAVQVIIIAVHVISFTTFPLLSSGILDTLFGNPDTAFYWFIAPLILVAVF
ncbi:hypothetical protein A3C89_03365 [Candidatus Kaiserbacteria bacterium RIFCSPHIGHO2_02_FULL_50_50]|uniref:Colicin V production protein n=1 Tax=Candidatus Kaiserbacteria bacterium RIFCSPHIGHO2_02_FULL_50_50 TaxID=1798492 RepID=A0A1F6DEU1_9BACT|nr:MAG: hypothetical protein A3C89_03365 [Candidatus Kaiserbacteria bacterium RIFCSPHIGHO2_02_FULL_50_50]OGG89232.1 MAG: hypothetical protein A3G62_01255 [Candidatus Kaiserbacteria bacterium RIFCSPLOWO2_12_FULL_50_10]